MLEYGHRPAISMDGGESHGACWGVLCAYLGYPGKLDLSLGQSGVNRTMDPLSGEDMGFWVWKSVDKRYLECCRLVEGSLGIYCCYMNPSQEYISWRRLVARLFGRFPVDLWV